MSPARDTFYCSVFLPCRTECFSKTQCPMSHPATSPRSSAPQLTLAEIQDCCAKVLLHSSGRLEPVSPGKAFLGGTPGLSSDVPAVSVASSAVQSRSLVVLSCTAIRKPG